MAKHNTTEKDGVLKVDISEHTDSLVMGYDGTATLSTEMVKPQINDNFVIQCNEIFQSIIDLINTKNLKGVRLYRNRDGKRFLKDLDSLVKKRFGFKLKHTHGEGMGYGVITQTPGDKSVLDRHLKDKSKSIKDYVKSNSGKKELKDTKEIYNANADMVQILMHYQKSVSSLKEHLKSDSVFIDRDRAHISNLPDDFAIFMVNDLPWLVNKSKLTAKELTAILLHEIGHVFTHLEYTYQTVINTNVIIETVQEGLKKDKSPNAILKMTYKELGGDPSELAKGDLNSNTLKVMNLYIEETFNMGGDINTHAYTDSEQLADQFSGRFGVSLELSSGLVKLEKTVVRITRETMLVSVVIFYLYAAAYTLIITGSAFMAVIGPGLALLYVSVISLIIGIAVSWWTAGGLTSGQIYDDYPRRLTRIRNEAVRQMRLGYISKDDIKMKLDQIDQITQHINDAKKSGSVNIIDKIFRNITSKGRVLSETKLTDQYIEDLLENSLHLSSHKLKSLGA